MSVLPARASIEYTCRLLRSYGVNVCAETLRQAKFNSDTAYLPVLQALHDLALCTLAGLPQGCSEGLSLLQQQLKQETLDAATLPPEARSLVLHWLLLWGCPAALIARICGSSSSSGSSRACLLALAWLICHARLFDRALQHLQISMNLLHLLPPYPQDTSGTAANLQRQSAAIAEAQQHHHRVLQVVQQPVPGPDTVADGCWPQVQTVAHQLLSTYRATSLRLQLLTSLQEGRERLLHDILQQQRVDTAPSNKSSKRKQSQVLSAFELHLLGNPDLLHQHQDALQEACSLLQQQLQCIQAAHTFFSWADSVVDQDQKAPQPIVTAEATAQQAWQRQLREPQQRHQRLHEQQVQLPVPVVSDIAPLVQQLPAADAAVASSVLQSILKQLQPIEVEGDSAGLQDFAAAQSSAAMDRFRTAAAVALLQAGVVSKVPNELLEIPPDIQEQLDSIRLQQQQQKKKAMAGSAGSLQPRWSRVHTTTEHLKLVVAQAAAAGQQQQSLQVPEPHQSSDEVSVSFRGLHASTGVFDDAGASEAGSGGSTSAAAETAVAAAMPSELQKLGFVALHVAKQLAKTRAANKQQIQVAGHVLLDHARDDVVMYTS